MRDEAVRSLAKIDQLRVYSEDLSLGWASALLATALPHDEPVDEPLSLNDAPHLDSMSRKGHCHGADTATGSWMGLQHVNHEFTILHSGAVHPDIVSACAVAS